MHSHKSLTLLSKAGGQPKDRRLENKYIRMRFTHSDVNVPGVEGHVSGESVCRCLAKKEAYAAVEALRVCADGRGGWAGTGGVLLQQRQGVGRAVAQWV